MQMSVGMFNQWCVATTLAMMSIGVWVNSAEAMQNSPGDFQPGVDVLTRGPVHEAFAETVTYNAEPGIVVSATPREIIEEVPPEYRPDGINVTWIPGYWAWDDERNDFLWISGIWRDLPPGRQWIPGYWGQTPQGYQWISGYWADASVHEVEYYPEPPESLEVGPNTAAPARNLVWMPGSWVWYQDRYAWRPGYWAAGRANWVWIPAQYNWAPRGFVYSDGYWDYPVERRGVIFAPVYFHKEVYSRSGYSYSPSIVINLDVFSDQLFVRPRYRHYYFGDYYDTRYRETGFFASFSYQSSRYGYDPIYAHRRWQNRGNHDWDRHDKELFAHRRDVVASRPTRTLLAQRELYSRATRPGDRRIKIAESFDRLAKRQDSPLRFQKVDQTERAQLIGRGRAIQNTRSERYKREAGTREAPNKRTGESWWLTPTRVRLPKPLIVSKPVGQLGPGQAPPKRHRAPALDTKIRPKPRRTDNAQGATRERHSTRSDSRSPPRKIESKEKPKKEDNPKHKPKKKSKD
jgi:hypothetical protein